MRVVKQYKLTLYYDGYLTNKKSKRNIKGLKYFNSKPTEEDIKDYIKDVISVGLPNKLRGLNIKVKKEYKLEI